jgi:prepilin-type processing-associated H-X9-DG protein
MYQGDYGVIGYGGTAGTWLSTLSSTYSQVSALRICPVASQVNDPTATATQMGDAGHCWNWGGVVDPTNQGSYTINGWLYGKNGASPPTAWVPDSPAGSYYVKDTAIVHASQTPEFGDGVWPDCWPNNTSSSDDLPNYGTAHINLYSPNIGSLSASGTAGSAPIARFMIARHGPGAPGAAPRAFFVQSPGTIIPGTINLSFADGHVETAKLNNLWSYYWSGHSSPQGHP